MLQHVPLCTDASKLLLHSYKSRNFLLFEELMRTAQHDLDLSNNEGFFFFSWYGLMVVNQLQDINREIS